MGNRNMSCTRCLIFGCILTLVFGGCETAPTKYESATTVRKQQQRPKLVIRNRSNNSLVFSLYGFTFNLERESSGRFNLTVAENPESRLDDRGVLLVTTRAPVSVVTANLCEGITSAMIDPGHFYVGINPNRDPLKDGIDMAFVTKGSVTWRGYTMASGQMGQTTFVSQLSWNKGPSPWCLNFGEGTEIEGLVRCRGFLSAVGTGSFAANGTSDKLAAKNFEMRIQLVPTTPGKQVSYVLKVLPETVQEIRSGATALEFGEDHEFVVEGFVDRQTPKIFAPVSTTHVHLDRGELASLTKALKPPSPYVDVLLVTRIKQLR